tara:strand:- start:492 stop:1340 length:849 start_codon:yes stop_codon:yes gene_type:complete
MRIDSSGNVGIGTASPANKLDVAGAINTNNVYKLDNQTLIEQTGSNIYFGDRDDNDNVVDISGFSEQAKIVLNDGFMTLSTGGSERARIDGSGNFLVGTTGVPDGTSYYGAGIVDGGGSSLKQFRAASSTTTAVSVARWYNPNGNVGSIQTSGSSTSYATSSDARLKDDIGDFDGLGIVEQLNPRKFAWKVDGQEDIGLYAQEVKELVPNAVSETEDGYYQMDYSKLVTPLIKAVQEQQKEIEELKKHSHSPKGLENMEGYENLIETIESLKAEIKLLKGGN